MKTDATQIIEQLQAEAFQDGWNDLAQRIKAVLENPTQKSLKSTKLSTESPFKIGNPFEADSGAAQIYDYVKSNPGLRGRDIIKNTNAEGKNVRTTLFRMKKRGIAVNESGKWRVV